MNYNNLAQKTNWTAGTDKFPLVPFYLTNISIPGMNFSVPETGSRFGARINLASDTITYNSLSFEKYELTYIVILYVLTSIVN